MRRLRATIGLTVNEKKAKLVKTFLSGKAVPKGV
jgi:hypothetical protein